MNFDLKELAKKKIIVVAHRGACGGNIPCNTLVAYKNALYQGADMIEIDVTKSGDGNLFIFHPGMEVAHLNKDVHIEKMSSDDVKKLRYVNSDNTETQFGINTLDEIFEEFKGKCYINVDKFWNNPVEIYKAIKRHGIGDQVLVKSGYSKEVIDVLSEVAPEIPFIPIVRGEFPQHEELKNAPINYVGAEVLFEKDDFYLASEEFISMMHGDGKLVWANSIIYSYKSQLVGGHSDDLAISGDKDNSWGWLARRGFDFIQTDFPILLKEYLEKENLLYRR